MSKLVAVLGPKGTFTEEAARSFFKKRGEIVFYSSIPQIFSAVERMQTDYGVVPVENNVEGSVNQTLDLLLFSSLKIIAEVFLPISFCLVVNPKARSSEAKKVFGHQQALAQCNNFLEANYSLPRKEVDSNAKAVQLLQRDLKAVAVGTKAAARLYGMKVLECNINDYKNNTTRFLVLSRQEIPCAKACKTSIVFATKHEPGALFKALKAFYDSRINLTKIESRPRKGVKFEYVFFCDFEGTLLDKKITHTLDEVRKHSTFLKVISSYPKTSGF